MRNFLERQHYRNGAVTIDASDWYIDLRLKERLHKNLNTDLTPYRDYYLNHIWDRAQFYNNLSIQTIHREVKHTLLLHYNLLNALFLDDLLSMFENRGWTLISARAAYSDPVFYTITKIMPCENSLLWQIAKESGNFDSILRNPGEDAEYEKDVMDQLGL